MATDANIRAVITADDRASNVLSNFGNHVGGIGSKIAGALELAAKGVAVASAAATAFGVLSVKAFNESEDAIAQTNAVLKSTGGIAGVTADQVTKLATSLQKQTKFSDESVRSAENLLLTFTSIGKEIFPQATETVLDMATALGEDTKSAAIQLGKALQDPILGITALRRVGVNFSDAQKDVIQNLVETGHKAEAQKLILKELQVEFGGSARAAGDTFAGSLAKLKNQFNDVQEVIGQTITEHLKPFVTAAANAMASIDWQAVINRTLQKLSEFWGWLGQVKNAVIDVGKQVADYLLPKFEAVWSTLTQRFIPAVVDLVRAIGPAAGVGLVAILGLAVDALNILMTVATPVFQFLADHTSIVWALVAAFAAWKAVLIIDAVVGAFQAGMAILRAETMLTAGTMGAATGAAGGLRLAILGLLGPWEIVLGILGVAAVIEGIKQISNALDDLLNKWAGAGKTKVGAGKIEVDSNSGVGLTQRFMNAFKGGFAYGGYTGSGGVNEIAGIVHKGEYVLPQSMVDQNSGLPKIGSGGQTIFNVSINAGAFMGTDVEARKFAKYIMIHMKDLAAMKQTTAASMLGA